MALLRSLAQVLLRLASSLAWILLLLAVIALTSDLTRTATGGPRAFTSALSYWQSMSPQSLASTSGFIRKSLHPLLWDAGLLRILILPTWLLLGAIGLLCAVVGRRKRRVNIFAN